MIFKCKSCGSNVFYDIKKARLVCQTCGRSYPVTDYDDDEEILSDLSAYQCESCGATLITASETDATAFCSYCGSHSILTKKIDGIKRPDRIIPFTKTAEDCRNAYLENARHAFLAPSWVRKQDTTDRFRPIYIPYWTYTIRMKDGTGFDHIHALSNGPMKSRKLVTYYRSVKDVCITTEMHDGSKAFSDDISECINFDSKCFDLNEEVPFRSGYLSGAYADLADDTEMAHEQELLRREMTDYSFKTVPAQTKHKIMSKPLDVLLQILILAGVFMLHIHVRPEFVISVLATLLTAFAIAVIKLIVIRRMDNAEEWTVSGKDSLTIEKKELIYCPVWFMGRKNGKRFNYAAVNGSTGHVVADYPVSVPRFLLMAGAISLAVFLLLQLLLVLRPEPAFAVSSVFGIIAVIICNRYYRDLQVRADISGIPLRVPSRKVLFLVSMLLILVSVALSFTRNNILIYSGAALIGLTVIINCLLMFSISRTLSGHEPPQLKRKGDTEYDA